MTASTGSAEAPTTTTDPPRIADASARTITIFITPQATLTIRCRRRSRIQIAKIVPSRDAVIISTTPPFSSEFRPLITDYSAKVRKVQKKAFSAQNQYQEHNMENHAERYDQAKFEFSCLVMKQQHAEEGAEGSADCGEGQKRRLRDPVFAVNGAVLVKTVQYQGDDTDDQHISNQ